jgi:hypothetical protein
MVIPLIKISRNIKIWLWPTNIKTSKQ